MNERLLKFGGSSVSNARNIARAADLVVDDYLDMDSQNHYSHGNNFGVIVSALGTPPGKKGPKVTDQLLSAVSAINKEDLDAALKNIYVVRDLHYNILEELRLSRSLVDSNFSALEQLARQSVKRLQDGQQIDLKELSDSLVAAGELSSTPILAALVERKLGEAYKKLKEKEGNHGLTENERKALAKLERCNGSYTVNVDPGDAGFITDSNFTKAALLDTSLETDIAMHYQSLRSRNPNKILFYAGFVAKDVQGRRTTLGRDGSNVTVIALGSAIKASGLTIYTDTDGVLVANPKIIGGTQTVRHLSYDEVVFLAQSGGMKVVQNNSLDILKKKEYPLKIVVRNSFNPNDPGTIISPYSEKSGPKIKGIGIIEDVVYKEFALEEPDDFGVIEESIERYKDVRLLYSACERKDGKLVGRFLLATNPIKDRDNDAYFGKGLIDHIKKEVYDDMPGRFDDDSYMHVPDCALITYCGEGLGASDLDFAKVVETVANVEHRRNSKASVHHLPIFRNSDSVQVVVPKESVDEIVRTTYNQMKKINIVLYGLGKVGSNFLREIIAKYDEQGFNVVGVADSSGVLAKIGGFNNIDLGIILEGKTKGRKMDNSLYPSEIFGAEYLPNSELRKVRDMEKGDFVLVDATNDPNMLSIHLYALHLGMDIISVNKTPYALPIASNGAKEETQKKRRERFYVNNLFRAIFEGREHVKGTVGADLGVPTNLIEILAKDHAWVLAKDAKDRAYISVRGCMSGTLGYTVSELDKGKKLSEAIDDAVKKGFTEPKPFDDYSGRDVLNKILILWRMIATRSGIDLNDCEIEHSSFIQVVVDRYNKDHTDKFDLDAVAQLKGETFVERMRSLDDSFDQIRIEVKQDHTLRYVAELSYDAEARRYKISVGLKEVQKESRLGELTGPNNLVLFSVNGESFRSYGLEPGPGAGVPETTNAIMHDLEEVVKVYRGSSQRRVLAVPENHSHREKGPRKSDPLYYSPRRDAARRKGIPLL
ncbi:TPA: hypothetical protein HA246_04810 [Candidatus Woesearchaeota archaeon]|nr:hypothetical protein [Candidatus Woesearchaeota archaeon]